MGILPNVELTPPKTENGQITVILKNFNGTTTLLSRMWAQQKRRIQKVYNLDIAGTFQKGKNDNEILCIFIKNVAYAMHHNIDSKIYEARFNNSCNLWLEDFRGSIEQASIEICQGVLEEQILHNCFPEKKARKERAARKAAKKTAKRAKKRPPNYINGTNTAKASH